ncbi:immunity 26/phosphotriesterase HocA family protein [bacterium]|nr:immunity 26/phosphotriesterase HocA family protein [bacterium]
MKKLPHGDIFAVPLPDGTFLHGRVLLDIYLTLKRRLFPANSTLPGLGEASLIEMYAAISESVDYAPSPVLIPGAFVESKDVGNAWKVVDRVEVDPREVEFPETVIGFIHSNGQMAYQCGEIHIGLPFPLTEQERINAYSQRHSAFLWPYTCLRVMKRDDEIPLNYKAATLEGTDLRISAIRQAIYEHLPFRMEESYFEKQAQLGLHFERLYE